MGYRIIEGEALEQLRLLPAGSVQTCITSPPYWGLRDYGTASWEGGDAGCDHAGAKRMTRYDYDLESSPIQQGSRTGTDAEIGAWADLCPDCGALRQDDQLGLESDPDAYVARLVGILAEVRRVLRDNGTLWLNIGDSYASGGSGGYSDKSTLAGFSNPDTKGRQMAANPISRPAPAGLKPKDLAGIPWRVAFALQADGWYLRSDVIWAKPNPMPESVSDRPTRSHEYLFLLAKRRRYFYDADAIRAEPSGEQRTMHVFNNRSDGSRDREDYELDGLRGRNKPSVWTVATQPYADAHFATFPLKLIEPCVLAGSPPKCCGDCGAPWEREVERNVPARSEGTEKQHGYIDAGRGEGAETFDPAWSAAKAAMPDRTLGWIPTCDHDDDSGRATVLDPFAGAGTTGLVACRHNRDFIGIELNPEYAAMARERIFDDAPLLNVDAGAQDFEAADDDGQLQLEA